MTSPTAPSVDSGDIVLLRYRYRDGSLQGAMPMYTVEDTGSRVVAWLPSETQIMYWALPDGSDPRRIPLAERFHAPLTTAPRRWQGGGVLRIIPIAEPYQVIHFWNSDGQFTGWYVNLEAPKVRRGACLDTVDWHLDLWIDADGTPNWKDVDEAEAAVAAGQLGPEELALARRQGGDIIASFPQWLDVIGDWRTFTAPEHWGPLPLATGWDQ